LVAAIFLGEKLYATLSTHTNSEVSSASRIIIKIKSSISSTTSGNSASAVQNSASAALPQETQHQQSGLL
jgi:hypothetical protein